MAVGVGAAGTALPQTGHSRAAGRQPLRAPVGDTFQQAHGIEAGSTQLSGSRCKAHQAETKSDGAKNRQGPDQQNTRSGWRSPGLDSAGNRVQRRGRMVLRPLADTNLNFGLPAVSMRFRSAVGIMCKSARDPDR